MEPMVPTGSPRFRAILGNRLAETALVLATLAFLVVTATWIRRDTVPPLWDSAHYLQQSTTFFRTLQREGTLAFLETFSHSMGQKAPLIAALPIPFYFALGESHFSARCVNLAWIIVASIFLFRLGRLVAGDMAGLLAVIVLNSFPLVAGMSRQYLVEYGLMTMVILWMYYLLLWQRRDAKGAPWILGAILGFGLLLKVTLPLYIAAPTIFVFARRLARGGGLRRLLLDLMRIAAVALPIAALWYSHNLTEVSKFVISGSVGDAGRPYGLGPVFSPETIAKYWLNLINTGTSSFYFAILLLVVAGWIANRWRRSTRSNAILADRDSQLLVAWCLFPWLALTFSVNKELRYTVPYLPALALILGAGIAGIESRLRRILACSFVVALGLLNYLYYSFGSNWIRAEYRFGSLVLVSDNLGWARPPTTQAWPVEEVVRAVADDAASIWSGRVDVRVLFSHANLNAHVLNYQATLREQSPRFLTVHFQSPDPLPALIAEINSEFEYLLTKSAPIGPPMLNGRNLEVAAALERGDLQFVPIAAIPLPDGSAVTVHRRTSRGESVPARSASPTTQPGNLS